MALSDRKRISSELWVELSLIINLVFWPGLNDSVASSDAHIDL